MKMEQYHALQEVILNGNSVVQMTKDEAVNEIEVPFVTAQQILVRTREKKLRALCLWPFQMSILLDSMESTMLRPYGLLLKPNLVLPILKKGEYILWTMKMEQYHALQEVILNGNSVVQMTKDEAVNEIEVPFVTAQQIL
nr:hypothetical protein [Tanacetum cinerariifolium]